MENVTTEEKNGRVPYYGRMMAPVETRGLRSWTYQLSRYDSDVIRKCAQALIDQSERIEAVDLTGANGSFRDLLPLIRSGGKLPLLPDTMKKLRITIKNGGPVTVIFAAGKDSIQVEAPTLRSGDELGLILDRAVHAAVNAEDTKEEVEEIPAVEEDPALAGVREMLRENSPRMRLRRLLLCLAACLLAVICCFVLHAGIGKHFINGGNYERGFAMMSANLFTKKMVQGPEWQQKNIIVAALAELEKEKYDHALELLERVPDKEEARFIQLRDACLYSKAISNLPFSLDTLGPQKDSFMTLEKNKKDVWTESKNMFAACVEHPYAKKLAQLMTLIEKRENGEAMSIIWALHEEGYTDVDMVALAKRLRKRDLPRMADGYLKYLKEYAEIVGGPSFSAESVAAALEKIDLTGIAENRIVATGALDALVEKTGSKENGSVLILLKGEAPMTYASDVLMELLPADLRPASLEEVSYIVVIECWTTVEGYYGHFPLEADALREHAVLYVYSSGSTTPVFQSKEYKGPNPPKTIEYSSPFPPDTSGGPPDIEEPLFEMMKKYIPGLS